MLPEEISRLRAQLGWSMSRLARELGVPAELVVDWESGERFPTRNHDRALVALDCAREESDGTTEETSGS